MEPTRLSTEEERIRKVYQAYDASVAEHRKRTRNNPGNTHISVERDLALRRLITTKFGVHIGALRVLDVGCGTGGMLAGLVELGAERHNLVGLDLLPDRIETALALHPG